MRNRLLELISKYYKIEEVDTKELHTFKASGMKFTNYHYNIVGFGSLSFMESTGMLGLMKVLTCVVNPFMKDAPLLSLDRINAMGNDILIMEVYDTLLSNSFSDKELKELKNEYKDFPDRSTKPQWYDYMQFDSTIGKVGKKKDKEAFNNLTLEFFDRYFKASSLCDSCNEDEKRAKARIYSEGLLEKGGPATDPVKKSLGLEKTQEFFRKVLFATDK